MHKLYSIGYIIPLALNLFAPFSPVAFPAKHLAVLNDRSPTFTPRSDVVTFHEFIVKLLATNRADMLLLFPHSQFDVLRECPKVEVVFVACQHIGDDAHLFLNLAVTHQCRYALSQGGGVKCF